MRKNYRALRKTARDNAADTTGTEVLLSAFALSVSVSLYVSLSVSLSASLSLSPPPPPHLLVAALVLSSLDASSVFPPKRHLLSVAFTRPPPLSPSSSTTPERKGPMRANRQGQ